MRYKEEKQPNTDEQLLNKWHQQILFEWPSEWQRRFLNQQQPLPKQTKKEKRIQTSNAQEKNKKTNNLLHP
jgi:hypothetical protein